MPWKISTEFTFDAAHTITDYDGPCGRLHGHFGLEVLDALLNTALPRNLPTGALRSLPQWVLYLLNQAPNVQVCVSGPVAGRRQRGTPALREFDVGVRLGAAIRTGQAEREQAEAWQEQHPDFRPPPRADARWKAAPGSGLPVWTPPIAAQVDFGTESDTWRSLPIPDTLG